MTAMARESDMRRNEVADGPCTRWFALRVEARRPSITAASLTLAQRGSRSAVRVDGLSGAAVARIAPRGEYLVEEILLRRGIRAWVPVMTRWNRANRYHQRKKVLSYQPILPGYVLAALPCDDAGEQEPGVNWPSILGCPMVRGVMGFGGVPAAIPFRAINELRAIEVSERAETLHRMMPTNRVFRVGEQVEILDGPLALERGRVIEITPEEAKVVFHLFGGTVPVRVSLSNLGAV